VEKRGYVGKSDLEVRERFSLLAGKKQKHGVKSLSHDNGKETVRARKRVKNPEVLFPHSGAWRCAQELHLDRGKKLKI